MIFVDCCIYIRWLRDRADIFAELGDHLRRGDLATCGVVRAEVLRGIVSVPVRERMELLFSSMHEVAMVPELWTDVAQLAWALDRRGEVLPLTDIAIAACAQQAGATVITTDPHFAKIPGLKRSCSGRCVSKSTTCRLPLARAVDAFAGYARMSLTTWPWTSVRRNWRPWNL